MPDSPGIETGEPVSLTGTLVGRFAIRERIGVGGMGEVYRADDTKLNRSVAVKRMSGAMRSDPLQRRRFVKEAERVSQLTDPHIAALFDILEEQAEIFLIMELVEGWNLRERLAKETSLKELLAIVIQTAEGLRSAHARNIVHCDIKPENIMITSSGQVKVLDFGLARRLSRPDSHASSFMSGFGISGTPGYMSPEMMLEETPDPRSDIFALGVVFYEALSGKNPFLKRTVFETADSVLHSTPAKLEASGVAQPLSEIIARMMAKEPGQRYQTADELISDLKGFAETTASATIVSRPLSPRPGRLDAPLEFLRRHRWFAIASVLIIVAAIGFGPMMREGRRLARVMGLLKAPHIAVLPFQNIGGQEPEQAFAGGLSDVITSELTQLSDRYVLQVVPATEVRSEGVNSAKAARQQFGVDLVVEGSLQPVANMIRATFSVVDANTGRQVRAGTVSVPSSDPFALQDQLASSIVSALGIDVSPSDQGQLAARGTKMPAAYGDYLQGLGYLEDYQKKENVDLAIAAFNRALQHDSSYALAYSGLGEAHSIKYREQKDPSEISDAGLACQRALAIDGDFAEGHRCLGLVFSDGGKYQQAAEQFEIAVKKRPTDDESVRALGWAYQQLRQFEKAEATYRRAIDLRPHYWAGYSWLGAFYSSRGQFPKALEMFEQVMKIAPENYRGYNNAGGISILQGDFGKAINLFERSVQIRPSFAAYSNLGTAYFFQKRFAQAATVYSQALQLNGRDYVTWGNLGDAQYFAPGQRASSGESYTRAVNLAQEELKVNPKDAGALGSLAMYYSMLGRRGDAEEYLKRALALQPEGPDVWWQASVVYSQLGRTEDTLAALQSALAAGLSSPYITSAAYFDNLHSDPRFQQLIKSAAKLERH